MLKQTIKKYKKTIYINLIPQFIKNFSLIIIYYPLININIFDNRTLLLTNDLYNYKINNSFIKYFFYFYFKNKYYNIKNNTQLLYTNNKNNLLFVLQFLKLNYNIIYCIIYKNFHINYGRLLLLTHYNNIKIKQQLLYKFFYSQYYLLKILKYKNK